MGNEASLEGEGLPEGLAAAAAAAAGGGAGGTGSPLRAAIPAGMEADLSRLSEEERRQIAAVMSRAQGLPKGSVPAAAAEPPSMHRHAQHDVYVRAYMYSPCTYVPARQYIYVVSVHFILPGGVAITKLQAAFLMGRIQMMHCRVSGGIVKGSILGTVILGCDLWPFGTFPPRMAWRDALRCFTNLEVFH